MRPPFLAAIHSATALLMEEAELPVIPTSCSALDKLLGGGVACGRVLEFCGVPGVGKTQLGYGRQRCHRHSVDTYKHIRTHADAVCHASATNGIVAALLTENRTCLHVNPYAACLQDAASHQCTATSCFWWL